MLQVVEPATPVLVGPLPASLVAAAVLAIRGGPRWAVPAGLVTAVLMIPLEPLPGSLAALAALAFLVAAPRPARRALALAALGVAACLLVVGTVPAAPKPVQASWRAYLADPAWSVQQSIGGGGGGDSVWVFGRITTRQADLQVPMTVNGVEMADPATLLPTDQLAWTRVALPAALAGARQLDVTVRVRGRADAQSRYVEIGGYYAHSPSPGPLPGFVTTNASLRRDVPIPSQGWARKTATASVQRSRVPA